MADKIAVFLADGFEEIEGLATVDLCRRAGIEVATISIRESPDVMGSHGIPVKADMLLEDLNLREVDMLVLPGGGAGTQNLEKCEKLTEMLLEADREGKYLSAICAAPRILGRLGLLKGRKACCFPGNEEYLEGAAVVTDRKAVRDGRFITARGMGASIEFAAEIINQLLGQEKAEEILRQVQFVF